MHTDPQIDYFLYLLINSQVTARQLYKAQRIDLNALNLQLLRLCRSSFPMRLPIHFKPNLFLRGKGWNTPVHYLDPFYEALKAFLHREGA